MSELRILIEAARAAQAEGRALALATVVQVEGSAYRQPGARMLFDEQRWLAGSVSGGCLERDIVSRGFWRTRHTGSALVTYDASSDERRGTGCDGVVHVLLQRVATDAGFLALAECCLAREQSARLATVIRARDPRWVGASLSLSADGRVEGGKHAPEAHGALLQALVEGRCDSHVSEIDGLDVFLESIAPSPHLFVFGTAHDALPLVSMAKSLGFSVSVCSADGRASTRARFAQADRVLVGPAEALVEEVNRCARPLAVVMAHHYEHDLSALRALLPSRALYIGVLGATRRAQRMRDDLALEQHAHAGRLHAPVGLQIGAEGPAAIALSILAEAHAVLQGESAEKRSLRARAEDSGVHTRGPIGGSAWAR